MTTMLQAVESGSFAALSRFINTARFTYNTLTAGVQLDELHARADRLRIQVAVSRRTAAAGSTVVAQHREQYGVARGGRRRRAGGGAAADRRSRRSRTSRTRRSDSRSSRQAADGEVAQLQLIAQMIGITNSQLTRLNQSLATTGRVLDGHGGGRARPSDSSRSAEERRRAPATRTRARRVAVPDTLP